MATKKKEEVPGQVFYAPVKWKGHTFKVIGIAEGGLLVAGEPGGQMPATVYFVPTAEVE